MRNLVLFTALAAVGLPLGQAAVAGASERAESREAAPLPPSQATKGCPAQQQLGELLTVASEEMAAAAQWQQVIERLSSVALCNAKISLLLAGAYEGSGDMAGALKTLETAHARWPDDTSIAASVAREYLGRGDVDKAVEALGQFHVSASTPPQELEEAGLVYIAGHQLEKAQVVAEATYRRYPTQHFLLLLANVLQLQGRYKDVNTLLAGKREAYGNSAPFLITSAESEYDAMLYDAARKDLEEAIRLEGNSYQAHYLLGNALLAQGEQDQAAAEYRLAIGYAPNQPRTYYQLALISRARQDGAGEEKLLQQALAADDHYAPAYCEEGRILLDQHRLKDAVDRLNLAIQYNPQTEQAYYLLARAYAGLGEKEKSEAVVKQYTKIRATNRHSSMDTHPGQMGAADAARP